MSASAAAAALAATCCDDTGGDLPPVVLIHGVGLSRRMWAAQVAALRDRHRLLTVDMLGHGASPMPDRDATLEDYADHVAAVMDGRGVEHAVLVGFSMGALVARAFALRHPARVDGLVLLNGVFDRAGDVRANILSRVSDVEENGPAANLDAAIERWFSPAFRAANPDYFTTLRREFAANDRDGYATTYRLFATEDGYGSDRLSRVAAPVLVATGEHDVGSTPEMAEALAARIPGATARIVADARHMMPVEMPEATNALLRDFLDALPDWRRAAGEMQ